ncbi:hypothetical protein [Bradyrhizobium sp. ORS 111]|uniref:hypothetical protein n=1 Tax=Bradyrhizobium sp. ORS 111 TaxID=1685958 RepID=UPI0038902299
MKRSQLLLDNAVICSKLARRSNNKQTKALFKRMEDSWRALAREQDWLDGEIAPVDAFRFGRPVRARPSHAA